MKQITYNQKKLAHISFEIGLLLKGIHGLMEIVGGAFLVFLSPARMNWLTRFLTRHELSEDPKDIVANFLISLSNSFSISYYPLIHIFFKSLSYNPIFLIYL